tara:strand:- start:15287 stop:16264 length:978 start_codon:yes stop_codon:yes gene_type:complete
MNITVKTKVSTVTCVQASRCALTGKKIFTLELEYPRPIHAQLLTHGVFSKNSSSTRAVPLHAAIKQLRENPAQYVWTINQSGMQGVELKEEDTLMPDRVMVMARESAIGYAQFLNDATDLGGLGIHKQNAGRLLEPFQNIKIVLTSTEWENWDWLRNHEDAQGEIADLARAIKEARDSAEVLNLKAGEWHVPYVERIRHEGGLLEYGIADSENGWVTLSVEEAKKVSMSVCAQISYRKSDTDLEKADRMKGNLVDGHRVHASPFEHQATPVIQYSEELGLNDLYDFETWEDGVTHLRRDGVFGSGNFVGWIQHRQLIPKHDKALF